MLEGFASLVGVISNVMYSYLLIIMLLAVGLYFTHSEAVSYSSVCFRNQSG